MSTATGEKTMEWENQIMQDSREEGGGGSDGDELAAAELMSLNICAICWGSPSQHTLWLLWHRSEALFFPLRWGPYGWFHGVSVSSSVSTPAGWVRGPEGADWMHAEGGAGWGGTGNYHWQPSPGELLVGAGLLADESVTTDAILLSAVHLCLHGNRRWNSNRPR